MAKPASKVPLSIAADLLIAIDEVRRAGARSRCAVVEAALREWLSREERVGPVRLPPFDAARPALGDAPGEGPAPQL
jgi:hypothetical protein